MSIDYHDTTWESVLASHAAAADAYCRAARSIDAAAWRTPVAPGKWSPAEITEHLNQIYDVVLDQLRGGPGLQIRTGSFVRWMLRRLALRRIMRRREIPVRVSAPAEATPLHVTDSQAEAVARMRTLAGELEREVTARRAEPGAHLTHHLFGSFDLLPAVDFVAIHIEHHCRQIAGPRDGMA
jgi:hypothetical protein